MRKIHFRLAAAVASALVSTMVIAQNTQEITVVGTSALTTKEVGQTPTGITIVKISLDYGVDVSDLDLASTTAPDQRHRGALSDRRRCRV